MFSYLTLAQRIPADHSGRQIRVLVDRALERMDAELEKLRGLDRVDWLYRLTIVAYHLVRMRRLIAIESLAH